MQRTLLFSVDLLGCLAAAAPTRAQDLAVPGDLNVNGGTVAGQTRLGNANVAGGIAIAGDLSFTGSNPWTFHTPNDGRTAMYLVPGTIPNVDWTKQIRFESTGDVRFSKRVSIGDVACTTPSDCPTTSSPLGINNLVLAVGGKIGARFGVHVLNAGVAWPDYVFAADYPLQPLPEVAAFVAAHQHLPGVPLAEEVRADGVELVTMQALLLQKVEELTLHLIRLEAANGALQARVRQLER